MNKKWLIKFTGIAIGVLVLIIHFIFTGVLYNGEKEKVRNDARYQAISSNEILGSLLLKEEKNLKTFLGSSSVKDRGKRLAVASQYRGGYLFSLQGMNNTHLFGEELLLQEKDSLKRNLRGRWMRSKAPFDEGSFINIDGKIYLIKYYVDFEEAINYILVLSIDSTFFNQVKRSSRNGLDRNVIVYNEVNEVIAGSIEISDYELATKAYEERLKKGNLYIQISNDLNYWKVILEYKDIYSGLYNRSFKRSLLLTLPFGMILLFITYLFSNRFYKPMSSLMKFLEENIEGNPEEEISQMIKVKNSYERSLPELREQKILDYIKGRKEYGEDEICELIPSEPYHLMLLLPESLIVHKKLKELLSKLKEDFTILRDEQKIILIFHSHSEDFLRGINDLFGFVKEEIVSFSSICSSVRELKRSYKEVVKGVYFSIKISSNIISPELIDSIAGESSFPVKEEEELFKSIKDQGFWKDYYFLVFKKIADSRCTIVNTKFMFIRLLTDIYNFSKENKLWDEEESIEDLYYDLDQLKTRKTIEEFFYKILSQTASRVGEVKYLEDKEVTDSIEEYIEANYRKVTFTVSSISIKIGYSISHLERKFKKIHNNSIKSHIIVKRIALAKSIMESRPDIKIKDLAYDVGYENSKSFINIFKKYEGLTPGEYKKNLTLKKTHS